MLCVQVAYRVARGFPSELLAELLAPEFPRWTIQAFLTFRPPWKFHYPGKSSPFSSGFLPGWIKSFFLSGMAPISKSDHKGEWGPTFIWGTYSPTCLETGSILGIFGSEAKSLWGPLHLIYCVCSNHKDHSLTLPEGAHDLLLMFQPLRS